MTREIADILIRQTVESDYEIERKIKLIERIERLVVEDTPRSVFLGGITTVDAKTMLQNGASVRETEEATGLSHRQVSKLSKELKASDNAIEPKGDIFTDEVIDNASDHTSDHTIDNASDHSEEVFNETPQESAALDKQEDAQIEPVRRVIPNNEQDNFRKLRETEIGSFMPPLPERTEAEKVKAEPPAVREAAVDDKLKKLMEQAPALMSEPAWKTFDAMYRRGHTYEELCNTWDFFHKTQPADWQERPQ